jgi:uncharacterized lipoprotein YmbA
MKNMINFCCLTVVLLLLAGCASSPSARRYVFAPKDGWRAVATRDAMASEYTVRLAPVHMPAYLDRPQIVTRINDAEIKIDQFHRWGMPLNVTVSEILSASIGRSIPEAFVDVLPSRAVAHPGYQIRVDIVRLDGQLGGEVELIAQWLINQGAETNRVVAQRLSRYKQHMETKRYEDYVEAVRLNVNELGAEMAEVIKSDAASR